MKCSFDLCTDQVVVCLQNELHEKVEAMGGTVSRDLTSSVTHLIAGEVGSKKYQVSYQSWANRYQVKLCVCCTSRCRGGLPFFQYFSMFKSIQVAASAGKQIYLPSWVNKVWEASQTKYVVDFTKS